MVMRNAPKHPVTPDEIAEAMDEWYANGKGGLINFCKTANPEAQNAANLWFERGQARFNVFIDAVRKLN